MNKGDMTVYRKRAKRYNMTTSKGTALSELPVEVRRGNYLALSDIPSPADLPELPERMRDFAVRTVIEGYKPDREWCKLFGVAAITIARWRRDDRVAKLRAYMLNERRGYMMAQTQRLDKKWWFKLHELLDIKITADTAPVVLQTLKYVRGMLDGDRGGTDSNTLSTFNINVGMGPDAGVQTGPSPYRQERDVTPQDLDKLQADLDREKDFLKNFVEMRANMDTLTNEDSK